MSRCVLRCDARDNRHPPCDPDRSLPPTHRSGDEADMGPCEQFGGSAHTAPSLCHDPRRIGSCAGAASTGQNAAVHITKLSSTDGFLAVDLPAAPRSVGVIRCARKILTDGAVLLARSITYSHASFGLNVSGASAAVNAEGDGRDAALQAAVGELAERVGSGALHLDPGKGVAVADVAPWSLPPPAFAAADAVATGVLAAALATVGPLDGRTVMIEAGAPCASAIETAFAAAKAVPDVRPLTEFGHGELAIVGSRPGIVDHSVAGGWSFGALIASGPVPVTARGLAVLEAAGTTVVPDFLSLAGPHLLRSVGDEPASLDAIGARIRDAVAAAATEASDADAPGGLFLAACRRAEAHLLTWVDQLPFGRPLA